MFLGVKGNAQLLGMKGADQETNIWKIRLQLMKPVTWIPLIWGASAQLLCLLPGRGAAVPVTSPPEGPPSRPPALVPVRVPSLKMTSSGGLVQQVWRAAPLPLETTTGSPRTWPRLPCAW